MSTSLEARQRRLAELQRLTRAELIHLILQHEAATGSPLPTAGAAAKKQKRQHDQQQLNNDSNEELKREATSPQQQRALPPSSPPPPSSPSPLSPQSAGRSRARKPPKPFDYWSYPVRHIALRFLYIGTDYYGYAAQPDMSQPSSSPSPSSSSSSCSPSSPSLFVLPTVESALFDALLTTRLIASRSSCHYQRCGRTDKGVHAAAQVASLWLRSKVRTGTGCISEGRKHKESEKDERRSRGERVAPEEGEDEQEDEGGMKGDAQQEEKKEENELDYPALLNRHLPPSIRILSYHPVPLSFSARFSCMSRTYHYLCYADGLQLDRMRQAASLMQGEHDWRNFCKQDVAHVSHFVRRIDRVEVREEDEEDERKGLLRISVTGNGFLYHQVRCMVGLLFLVGRGEEPVDVVRRLLDVQTVRQKPNYRMASEMGLILHDAVFAALPPSASSSSSLPLLPSPALGLANLQCCLVALHHQYRVLALRAAVIRHLMRPLVQLLSSVPRGMPVLPFQLDETAGEATGRRAKGVIDSRGNLQPSVEEKLGRLKGKKKERRDEMERWRAEWRRKEDEKRERKRENGDAMDADDGEEANSAGHLDCQPCA